MSTFGKLMDSYTALFNTILMNNSFHRNKGKKAANISNKWLMMNMCYNLIILLLCIIGFMITMREREREKERE